VQRHEALLDKPCEHCNAIRFKGEPAGLCCQDGKVVLKPLKPHPSLLQHLCNRNSPESTWFLENVRPINQALCVASSTMNKIEWQQGDGWRPTVFAKGKQGHKIGALSPLNDAEPRSFSQIYMYDQHEADMEVRPASRPFS
jgi:hypothetical protein